MALSHRSTWFLVFLGGLTAMAPFAIDTYLPAMPAMVSFFDTEFAAVGLTMTFYMIGSAFGQAVGGPLSDHVGRKPIVLGGLLVFLIASLSIVFATSIGQLQLLRALQALGGGAASVVAVAQLRDVYPAAEIPRRLATVMLVMLMAPMIAPIFGSLLMQLGWQAIFVFLAAYSALLVSVSSTLVAETFTGKRSKPSWRSMFGGYANVVTLRVTGRLLPLRHCLFVACMGGVFMSYLINSSFIYMSFFGLNEFQFALAFAVNACAMIAGNRCAAWLLRLDEPGHVLMVSSTMQVIVLGLLLLASLQDLDSARLVFPGIALLIAISGLIGPTASGVYMAYFEENIGSAASLNTITSFFVGSLIGALASYLSQGELAPILAIMMCSSIFGRVLLPR